MGSKLGFRPTNYEKSDPLKFGYIIARLVRIHEVDYESITHQQAPGQMTRRLTDRNGNFFQINRSKKDTCWTVTILERGKEFQIFPTEWEDLVYKCEKFIRRNCSNRTSE